MNNYKKMNNYKIYQIGFDAYDIAIVYKNNFFNIDELNGDQLDGIVSLLIALKFKDLTDQDLIEEV